MPWAGYTQELRLLADIRAENRNQALRLSIIDLQLTGQEPGSEVSSDLRGERG